MIEPYFCLCASFLPHKEASVWRADPSAPHRTWHTLDGQETYIEQVDNINNQINIPIWVFNSLSQWTRKRTQAWSLLQLLLRKALREFGKRGWLKKKKERLEVKWEGSKLTPLKSSICSSRNFITSLSFWTQISKCTNKRCVFPRFAYNYRLWAPKRHILGCLHIVNDSYIIASAQKC